MISFPDCSLRSKVVAGFPVCGLFLCGSAGGGIYLRDEEYMRHALMLASYARGRTSPNPMVGAVLVRDGEIVGQGWHRQAGTPHAEIHALRQAGELAKGATLYVTLEPCCHQGRTGPCTEAIIQAGVRRVVMAMTDPNPLVAGCGSQRLREAGVEVEEGLLSCEAALLNEVFIKGISTGMPFVVMKAAMTLDGKIASHTGHVDRVFRRAKFRHVLFEGFLDVFGGELERKAILLGRISCQYANSAAIGNDEQVITFQLRLQGKG